MKSQLFKDNPTPSKSLADEFNIVAELDISDEVLKIIPKSIAQYILSAQAKDEERALTELRTKWIGGN